MCEFRCRIHPGNLNQKEACSTVSSRGCHEQPGVPWYVLWVGTMQFVCLAMALKESSEFHLLFFSLSAAFLRGEGERGERRGERGEGRGGEGRGERGRGERGRGERGEGIICLQDHFTVLHHFQAP